MGFRICPICGGKIAEGRIDCIHCGSILIDNKIECEDCGAILRKGTTECPECGSTNFIDKSKENAKIRICPICGGKVSNTRNECIHCGYEFEDCLDKLVEDDGHDDFIINNEDSVKNINENYPKDDFKSYEQFIDSILDMIVIPVEDGKIKLWCTKAFKSDKEIDCTTYCIFESNFISDDIAKRYESNFVAYYSWWSTNIFGGLKNLYHDEYSPVVNQKILFPGKIIKDTFCKEIDEWRSNTSMKGLKITFTLGDKEVIFQGKKFELIN